MISLFLLGGLERDDERSERSGRRELNELRELRRLELLELEIWSRWRSKSIAQKGDTKVFWLLSRPRVASTSSFVGGVYSSTILFIELPMYKMAIVIANQNTSWMSQSQQVKLRNRRLEAAVHMKCEDCVFSFLHIHCPYQCPAHILSANKPPNSGFFYTLHIPAFNITQLTGLHWVWFPSFLFSRTVQNRNKHIITPARGVQRPVISVCKCKLISSLTARKEGIIDEKCW